LTPRLIVFDLDGTLIDSRRDLADSVNALLADLGADPLPLDAVVAMVGEGAALLVRRALTAAALDPDMPGALDRFLAHYDRRLLAHTRPYPGMVEALNALKTASTLAVLTNKPGRPTGIILESLGLASFFGHVIGGDTPHGRKPDPAGLLQLVRLAGATVDSTVMVGDSPVDRDTAQRAGTRLCLVRYGFGFRFAEEELASVASVVDRPSDLPRALGGGSGS
jgi:phosphoglycolate phosphatase